MFFSFDFWEFFGLEFGGQHSVVERRRSDERFSTRSTRLPQGGRKLAHSGAGKWRLPIGATAHYLGNFEDFPNMCRPAFASSTDYSELKIKFWDQANAAAPNLRPSWKSRGRNYTARIVMAGRLGERRIVSTILALGSIPSWPGDEKLAYSPQRASRSVWGNPKDVFATGPGERRDDAVLS